jgi:thymidylate synthase
MDFEPIVSNSLDDIYQKVASKILFSGEDVIARGLSFKECRFQHLVLTNPRNRIISNDARKFSYKFAMAEFIWIMSGQCNLEMIGTYNKRIREFSDDGCTLHGAYGPRLRHWSLQHGDVDQLENCFQRLRKDLYTRQASIVILDPAIDFTTPTKDVPCNNYLQFLYRENKLDLVVYVRSNDLYLGFPYDIFEWTMLQEIFAKALNVELGQYHHLVGSLHIYTQDFEKFNKIIHTQVSPQEMPPMPDSTNLSIIDELAHYEEALRTNQPRLPDLRSTWWLEKAMWLI